MPRKRKVYVAFQNSDGMVRLDFEGECPQEYDGLVSDAREWFMARYYEIHDRRKAERLATEAQS